MRHPLLAALCGLLLQCLAQAQDFGPWYVLGRFESEFNKGSTAVPLAPEKLLKQLVAGANGPDLAASFDGMDKQPVAWRKLTGEQERNALDVGALDLNTLCPPPASRKGNSDNSVCYLYRRIDAPRDLELPASLGSDDGVRLWLNGELLDDRHVPRALAVEDDPVTLRLTQGANHLLVKVTNSGGAYSFQIQPRARIAQQAINDAIDRGVQFLIREQLLDGSWGCWEHWGGGHAAYAAYTLLKCGVARNHPAVRMALEFTRQRPMDTTYARACLILALEACGDAESRERMQEVLAELVDTQTTSGLWDYPEYPGGSRPPVDMSNTLYAALALRAARKAGLEVPDALWGKLAGGTLRCQEREREVVGSDGRKRAIAGFGYRVGDAGVGSTTTAGLSVLAICEQEGGERMPPAVKSKLGPAKQLGMAWLEHHLAWSNNPGAGAGHHYFWIYGIERVGALFATEKIGTVDWYWDGAAYLVRAQRDDGSWNPGNYVDHQYLDTILALLFLKRATARGSGETSKVGVFETADATADVLLRATGDTPLTVWVSGLSDALNSEFSPASGAELDVAKVEYFARFEADSKTEPELIGAVEGARVRRGELQRFALRHSFDRRGTWLVRARVHLRAPPPADAAPGTPGVLRTVDSPELAVRIDAVVDPARLSYAADLGRNLLYGAKLKAEASSSAGGDDAPARAVDGNFGTRWRCAKDDEKPWLRLVLERPARADGLLLGHALPRLVHAGAPRVRKLAVVINKSEQFALELPDDVLAKAYLPFGQLLAVREIELRVVECSARPAGEPVGLSEVELVKGR